MRYVLYSIIIYDHIYVLKIKRSVASPWLMSGVTTWTFRQCIISVGTMSTTVGESLISFKSKLLYTNSKYTLNELET